VIHECSIIGCAGITPFERWTNPRDRWMLGVTLKDDGREINLNFCPEHVKELFGLHEKDFVELEKVERMVSEVKSTELVQ